MTSLISAWPLGNGSGDGASPFDGSAAGFAAAPSALGGAFGSGDGASPFDGSSFSNGSFSGLGGLGSGANDQGSMLAGLFSAISSAISQYFQSLSGQSPQAPQQFSTVNASSTGDPHDAVSGTRPDGTACNAHWDDMHSERDLLSSPSFKGGFHVATHTGDANAAGATMNRSVDVTSDFGRNRISFDANGQANVFRDGIKQDIASGQTLTLGGGTSVADQGNALVIREASPSGAELNTTLSQNGQGGVDVRATGEDVALGGYLIRNAT